MKKIEFALKNIFLTILLKFNSVIKKSDNVNLAPNSKILIIRLNKIGDALVTTPLLKLLKENSKCHISVLSDIKNSFVFDDDSLVDEVLLYKKGLNNYFKTIKQLNSKNFDAVIDLHDDISTTVSFIIALLKIPYKIGLIKGNEQIYTHLVPKLDPSKSHIVLRVMEFAKIFNLKYDLNSINIHYTISKNSVEFTDSFLLKNNINGFLVGINISAGSEARFWGVENFQKTIKLLEKDGISIVILSTEKEKKYAEEISGNQYPIFTNPDFNIFAAMISKLNFLFTPDTSIVHLASSYEIPMFGLYVKYNTNNMIWSPFKSEFDCIITEEPNFNNLKFKNIEEKLKTFFEKIYEQRNPKV